RPSSYSSAPASVWGAVSVLGTGPVRVTVVSASTGARGRGASAIELGAGVGGGEGGDGGVGRGGAVGWQGGMWSGWTIGCGGAVDSLAPVVVKAQTCSWVQYWLERAEAGDSGEASRALGMLDVLQTDEALGDLSAPIGAMINAAKDDDAERVQEIFRGARCDL